MKNLNTYILFLLLCTICFSCVKEKDILTESDHEIIPQEGETRVLTGTIRDTSGAVLPEASVKIILDDLELETEADENGAWNLIVPNTLTEGYVVSNKVEYSKSIQRFNETVDNRVEDIYLAREESNTELDLVFNQDNLKTVLGILIDEDANPITGVNLFLFSLLNGPDMEYVFNGFTSTSGDGSFEIIYEDGDFSSTTLFALIANGCRDAFSTTLQGEEQIEDLGDIELSYDDFSSFETSLESDGSSCYDNVSTLAYYWNLESAFQSIRYDQALGDISFEYCPKENSAFYVGVESEDNAHFNGLFSTEAEASYMLDICTPNPGNFLELNINGNVTLYEDDLLYLEPRTVFSFDTDIPLNFRVLNWATFTPSGSDQPGYQIGEIKSLKIEGENGIEFSNLDSDSPSFNYVNIVQDDEVFYAGIAQTKHIANDGSEVEVKIRFRVSK